MIIKFFKRYFLPKLCQLSKRFHTILISFIKRADKAWTTLLPAFVTVSVATGILNVEKVCNYDWWLDFLYRFHLLLNTPFYSI